MNPLFLLLQLGLDSLCQAIEGNFLNMPFPDNKFDGAYAIEATCHADKVNILVQSCIPHCCPKLHDLTNIGIGVQLQDVYLEIYRVLKPGTYFASYEWVSTKEYDAKNRDHVRIMDEINYGNGLPVSLP